MPVQPAFFESHAIRRVYDEKRNLVVLGGRYRAGADSTARLSDRAQVLEQAQGAAGQGGQSVGDRLSPTEIAGCRWEGLSGVSVKALKAMKGLKDHNLRDHMSEAELIFTALAVLSTRQIAQTDEATGMAENSAAASQGGAIARQARKALEAKTGKPVVTGENFLPPAAAAPRKVTKKIMNEAAPLAEHIDYEEAM